MLAVDSYLGTLAASALICLLLGYFFWRRMPAPGARAMIAFMGFCAAWSLGYIIEVFARTQEDFRLANNIEYIGIVGVPVLWLLFTLHFLQHDSLITRHAWFLGIIPAVTLALVWTNPAHGLMWDGIQLRDFGEFTIQTKVYGPWFWVHTVYSYAALLAGITLIVRKLVHPVRLFRIQMYILLFSVAFPMVWNVIYVLRTAPTYHVDMTAPAFALSGIVIAFGLFRFRILDIIPLAREKVFDRIRDGVIVLDNQDRILDMNQAAQDITGLRLSDAAGGPASIIWPEQHRMAAFISGESGEQIELSTGSPDNRRYYVLSRVPLYDERRYLTGQLITVHDDTENREKREELTYLSTRLIAVQEEERRSVARELHDEIGQHLSLIKMLLNRAARTPPEKAAELVSEISGHVSHVIEQVRDMSLKLRPAILDDIGLAGAVAWLAERIESQDGITISVKAEEAEAGLSEQVKVSAYRIVQESLTNILRHARASRVWITLKVENGRLTVVIRDNGRGFEPSALQPGKSTGVSSMRERVRLLHGTLIIDSTPGKGAVIRAELPLNRDAL